MKRLITHACVLMLAMAVAPAVGQEEEEAATFTYASYYGV